MNAPSVTS